MTFLAGAIRPSGDSQQICECMFRAYPELPSPRLLNPSPELTFGLSLCSSLPEDRFDRQPLEDQRYILAGDIRMDNRDEVISRLSLSRPESRLLADSDLFFTAWTKWQKETIRYVIGGFAVAVWDKQERELCLVRDHSGERPIHYASNGSTFAFASMPQSLRVLPGIDTSLNEEHLLHFLAIGPDCTEHSYFRNIRILQPGRLLTFRAGVTKVTQYWHPIDTPAIRLRSNREYEEAMLERFDAAVKARLRTTGRVGTQLSGGMDSSSVTATAARLMNGERLTAFTAVPQPGFADENPVGRFGNEGPMAALVAAKYPNIDHVLVDPSGGDIVESIEKMGRLYDMPVYNPLNQLWINAILDQSQARGIEVILQGVCGNATLSFGGLIGLSDLVRQGRLWSVFKQARELRARGYTSWRGAAYTALSPVLPLGVRRHIGPQASEFSFAYSPVHPDRALEHRLKERAFEEFFTSDDSTEGLRRKMFDYYDAGFANGGATLGWGISLRDPMQDKRVFDFCYAIPIEQYLAEGQTRSLVRRTMRDRLPAETLACTTRGLQAADWFLTMGAQRGRMAVELAKVAQSPTAQRLLDIPRLKHLLETWPSTGYERDDISACYHLALVRGLAAGTFMRQFETP